ncbi:hypothetical protein RDI58_002068 [Solanum bulbocastanum]|uniref:Uncharacterized protein n=1 Tax=Solanum bulbocastanum TaxID=147425 RepID=A0AAN8YQR5_SOLBU
MTFLKQKKKKKLPYLTHTLNLNNKRLKPPKNIGTLLVKIQNPLN